jgi:acyl-CoA thioester hydrolase
MSDYTHRHTLRVYYEDTDAGGIVYHAAYLRFAERARTEALRDMGLPHSRMQQEHGCVLVVKRVALEYERPARLDDSLVVLTRIRRASASLLLDQQAWRGEERLVRIEVKLACVDAATLAARRLPEPWLGALRARITDCPAEGGLAP